jgi:hypothetical protein
VIPRKVCLIAALAIALPVAAHSQEITILEGVVRDDGGGVTGAVVVAVDSLTNERRRAVTNDRGFFRMLDLSPGRYTVTVGVIGHVPVAQRVRLLVGERGRLDFTLERTATILETVRVEDHRAADPGISRLSVSSGLGAREIEQLPLNARNVMDLAALSPGIRLFQPISGHQQPAAGALRDGRGVQMYVDGVEMKNLNSTNVVGSPAAGTLLPIDGVEDFRVLLNPYDAEYARGAAYILSVETRRGNNERHGSLFGFFQNHEMVSVTNFQRQIPNFQKPDFSREQGGFSLRGPIVRNRLFYAVSYELLKSANFVAVIPGQPAANPTMWDSYAGLFNAPNRNQAGLLRLTYSASERSTLEAIASSRYFTGVSGFGGIQAAASAIGQRYGVNTVNLRHRWAMSNFANEASLQFVGWSSEDRPKVVQPELRYPTLTIGHADGIAEIHEKQFRAVDHFTSGFGSGPGSHLLKSGLEIARVSTDQFLPNNRDGLFRFRTETSAPSDATIGVGFYDPSSDHDALTSLWGWVVGGYVNDEWHPTSGLALNLGLRYDVELHTMDNDFTVPWLSDTAFANRPELAGLLNQGNRRDDRNNFSPRISFSWDVSGNQRTFIRGGFGIIFDRVPGFVPFGERLSAGWRNYMFTNPGTTDPNDLRDRVLTGGGTAAAPALTLLPHRMDVPENRQWSIGVGAQLTRGLALNVDFIDQQLRHLWASINLNWQDASQTPNRRALSSSYGNILAWGDFARGSYRGLLTNITYSRDTATRISLSHTLASAKADWDVQTVNVPAVVARDYFTMQRISGDERHRFVIAGSWMLRYGIGFSTIATAASPRPYRTTVGQDLNKDVLLDDDWIDGKRYQVPANVWRNWYRVVDVRLTKSISSGRGSRILLTAEAFNLFNTENYSGYSGTQRSAAGEPRPDFGSPSGIFATRQLQIGTRLQF